MIEKILERLEELKITRSDDTPYGIGVLNGYAEAISIVQEVAKEYAEPKEPSRCVTCANYDGEEIVDNICYLCCKGFEDNYKQREEEA